MGLSEMNEPYDRNSVILDIFENQKIMDVYENLTKLGPKEVKLAGSGSKVTIEMSPNIKAIYQWVRKMKHLERNSPEDYIQMELRDNGFDYTKEKRIMRILMSEDLSSIKQIDTPGMGEKLMEMEGKILKHSEKPISFLFYIFFFINWLYSTYILRGLLEYSFLFILILFIYSIFNDSNSLLTAAAVLIELDFIYHDISIFNLNIINILLFFSLVILYHIGQHIEEYEKKLSQKLSLRLPEKYRNAGIVGNEHLRNVEKMVYAKEKFIDLLQNASTSIDNTCPFCGGSGSNQVEVRELCSRCGGSGRDLYYDASEGISYLKYCIECHGTGYVTIYENVLCEQCISGEIPSEEFEKELGRRIFNLMDEIKSLDDSLREKIEIVNREIDILNQKILIWNSRAV